MQTRLEVPDPPVTLDGRMLQKRFVEFVLVTKETALVNPLIGEIVTVEVPCTPTITGTLVGLVAMAKSST